MAYKHGVYVTESDTAIKAIVETDTPAVVVGTAPVHLAGSSAKINEPVLCYTHKEFITQFGDSNDYDSYTLCEAADVFFGLYGVAPVVFINVLDPNIHNTSSTSTITGLSNAATIKSPVIINTLSVMSGSGSAAVTLVNGEDYKAEYENGNTVITIIDDIKIVDDTAVASYKEVVTSAVTADDIIGGYDSSTGKNTGIELVEEIYPRYGVIPGTLISPKYSMNTAVAGALKSKVQNINGIFNTIAISDIDTSTAKTYTQVLANKVVSDPFMISCWPQISAGGIKYYLSTQVAAVLGKVDASHDNLPYKSPSNENITCDKGITYDNSEVFLTHEQANYLNSQGVVTALNFAGGWRIWGNRTSCYPAKTDVKDTFIPVRRMLNFIGNTLVTSFWSRIDMPLTKRVIEDVIGSANLWLNGLQSRGAILGGNVDFLEEENPTTDLLDGILRFHVYISPPPPCRSINFTMEYNVNDLKELFS